MNILFSASGTGGHLIPAIRLARGVQRKVSDCRILFVGGRRGLEKQMITAAGFELTQISARGFVRRQPWKNIPVLWALGRSILACRRIVRRFHPDVSVGTGGYVTGPVIRAAHRAGVPTLIHEQNRRPGLTTRWLSKIADVACVAFAETKDQLTHPERVKVFGNPIDPEMITADRTSVAAELAVDPGRPTILVTGGSQGAASINENIARGLQQGTLPESMQLIWQTGKNEYAKYQHLSTVEKGVVVKPFVPDLARVMGVVNLVIARAGALTIAEITARGIPAILVPYPFAAADHQTENAQALVNAGAGELIKDADLASTDLLSRAMDLFNDPKRMVRMSEHSKKLGRPEATEQIVNEILRLAEVKSTTD